MWHNKRVDDDDGFDILYPFQHNLSHIETTEG